MAACLAMLVLTGCVSASWIAHRIVRPSTNSRASDSFRTFAHSFFSQRVILKVRPPDAGTIVASVMQPAPYDPDIGIVYKPGGKTESIELNFPRSVPPPRSALSRGLAELAKKDSFKAALESWRVWLSTLKAEKPVGTVIMLPGFGLDKDSLLPWALFFADRGWRVVLVDLRGQGRSQAPYLTWGIRDRNDLHRLVRALERRHILVKPWLYFGVSYGAGVALMAAAGAPGPDGVIAVAPWADADRVIARAGHRWGGLDCARGRLPGVGESRRDRGSACRNQFGRCPAQTIRGLDPHSRSLSGWSSRSCCPPVGASGVGQQDTASDVGATAGTSSCGGRHGCSSVLPGHHAVAGASLASNPSKALYRSPSKRENQGYS